MKLLRVSGAFLSWGLACIGSFILWTIWLVLAALLVLQIVIACSHELRVPARVAQAFKDRLSLSGLRVSFASASFDPSGHVLVEDLRVFNEGFEEPLATCRTLFVKLDPWAALVGSIEPEWLRGRGLTLYVPPMFSPSGRSEPVVEELEFDLRPEGKDLQIDRLTARTGKLAVSGQGAVRLKRSRARSASEERAVASTVLAHYLRIARQQALWQAKLSSFEQPALNVVLTPDDRRVAQASATFTARQATLTKETMGLHSFQRTLRVVDLRLHAALPLVVAPQTDLEGSLSARTIETDDGSTVRNTALRLSGSLRTSPLQFDPTILDGAIEEVSSRGLEVKNLSLQVVPRSWPQLSVELSAIFADQSWAVQAEGNPLAGAMHVSTQGKISKALLSLVGQRIRQDLNTLLTLEAPATVSAEVQLDPGGKPKEIRGHLEVGKVVARNVAIDAARADLFFSGTDFRATDIVLFQGENSARGSYTMDTKTLDYRFLLTGQLRPIGIAGWFHDWWIRFWDNFDFGGGIPVADVDVRGRWREPHQSTVFVFADCARPVIRTVPFDRVRLTLFIRPDFYDGLEVFATRGAGSARGHFTRSVDLEQHGFRWMEFDVKSDLDLQESARLFGPTGIEIVEPFVFEKPPTVTLAGRLEGEASARGEHENVAIDVDSTGAFTFFGFPLSNLNCQATVSDHEIEVKRARVRFAEGDAQGAARVTGRGEERKLAFQADLENASLGEAIRILEEFGAKRRGEKAVTVSRFQQRVATGKLDVHTAAKGSYKNPYSYVGAGTAELRGAELAEINLLGALSEALRGNSLLGFTSWRLDTARTSFTIDREKLILPDLRFTGPTARLEAHGTYALDTKLMSFNAKFYPFEEGKTLLANAVDFVLTPVSAALELKLSGNLDNPKWFFAYGPTNFFRKLTGAEEKPEAESAEKSHANAPPILLRR